MRVVFLGFEGVQSLDLLGPIEAFSLANRHNPGTYELQLLAAGAAPFTTSSGVTLSPHGDLAQAAGPIDTLMIPGGSGSRALAGAPQALAWVRDAAARSRRVCSVCTGAFVLAAAGLLDGRRATTHWASCGALQRQYPSVDVDPAPIYVKDGDVYTSAGVTAGIDLTLALIEQDLGREAALDVARGLVLFVRRPGGQSQFSATLAGQRAGRDVIADLQYWITEHLDHDLGVEALAERVAMSPRHFARVFSREVGVTPAAYVTAVRLERARTLLETTDLQLEAIAQRCGFGTVETMRRSFNRRLTVSPSGYRERFAAA